MNTLLAHCFRFTLICFLCIVNYATAASYAVTSSTSGISVNCPNLTITNYSNFNSFMGSLQQEDSNIEIHVKNYLIIDQLLEIYVNVSMFSNIDNMPFELFFKNIGAIKISSSIMFSLQNVTFKSMGSTIEALFLIENALFLNFQVFITIFYYRKNDIFFIE